MDGILAGERREHLEPFAAPILPARKPQRLLHPIHRLEHLCRGLVVERRRGGRKRDEDALEQSFEDGKDSLLGRAADVAIAGRPRERKHCAHQMRRARVERRLLLDAREDPQDRAVELGEDAEIEQGRERG